MNKQEAIKAMQDGNRITHRYFGSNEWITMMDGKIVTEEGYRHSPIEFWSYRTGDSWETGYSLRQRPVSLPAKPF